MSEPTIEELRGAVEDLVCQFAFEGQTRSGLPALTTGGLSALEHAFELLGWTDPHPAPWRRCQYGKPRCKRRTEGGASLNGVYMWLCGEHLDIASRRTRDGAAGEGSGG